MFLVKGRKRPFVKQVELSWKSFNSGDCFVVDPGKKGRVNATAAAAATTTTLTKITTGIFVGRLSMERERFKQNKKREGHGLCQKYEG